MQKRHKDRLQYFKEQEYTTKNYVIPYISEIKPISKEIKLLEIGCGEGGNIKPFLDMGCQCTGIDLSEKQIENAKNYFKLHPNHKKLTLINEDIYKVSPQNHYDVIIMRDVIEHIPDQVKSMSFLKNFIASGGAIFFGFPPWQMPFGGHQQVLNSKVLSYMPYIHLLPDFLYKGLMKFFGESNATVESRMDIKKTSISIERFEKIIKSENYRIRKKTYYFINPNYQAKFNLKPRKQLKLVTKVPWLRNFFTTAMYYIVSQE